MTWAFFKYLARGCCLLIPSVLCWIAAEQLETVTTSQTLIELAGVILWWLGCLASAALSRRDYALPAARRRYQSQIGPGVERALVGLHGLAAVMMILSGIANYFDARLVFLLWLVYTLHILLTAIIVPVDAGASLEDRMPALAFAVVVPLAVIIMLPLYLMIRPLYNRRMVVAATLSSVAMLLGLIVWATGEIHRG